MAAKLTKKEIKAALDGWADHTAKIAKLEASRARDLEEHEERFRAAAAEVDERYAGKLAALKAKADAIEADVTAWLKAQGEAITVSGEKAEAVNELKVGSRQADAKKFFDMVKDRSQAFWDCVSIGIAKAEALVGKNEIDAISTKPTKLVPMVRLKSND